ncbi:hypothetical protein P7K49_018344, partial [Saguinus oedipus]
PLTWRNDPQDRQRWRHIKSDGPSLWCHWGGTARHPILSGAEVRSASCLPLLLPTRGGSLTSVNPRMNGGARPVEP